MKLKKGSTAPMFTLPSINNGEVTLESFKGKKVLLVLNRWANCPFCSLTLTRIANQSKEFEKLGVEVLMVFPSSLEKIRTSLPQLELGRIQFLSDEKLSVYRNYGAEASFAGEIKTVLDLPNLIEALKHMKASAIFYDGKFTQLPCSVLIDEGGIIHDLNYGRTFTDLIDPEEVIKWASGVSNYR
ncbi:MAG: redoxin domain-containing protein [Cyclobacteriaceae bacterium]